MCAGVVPQHPPIILTPAFMRSGIKEAIISGDSRKTVLPSISSGIPAFAWIITGILSSADLIALGNADHIPDPVAAV